MGPKVIGKTNDSKASCVYQNSYSQQLGEKRTKPWFVSRFICFSGRKMMVVL